MGIVRLIHWNAGEAERRAVLISDMGLEVVYAVPGGPELLRELRANPPAALVIDLTRLPSAGRDIALAVRQYKATRRVPILFVEGDPEKVGRFKELLPDASYTTWKSIRSALEAAIRNPLNDLVVPRSRLEGYSGKPLTAKLGIKPGMLVGLIGAPPGFRATLGDLPQGARFRERACGRCDLLVWFVRSLPDLERGISRLGARQDWKSVWIAWPKKASGIETDVSEQFVRNAGLAGGLVDYKVCSIDAIWSGLQFARKKGMPRVSS